MSFTRSTQIGFCGVALTNNDADAFGEIIEKNVTLLDEPSPLLNLNFNHFGKFDSPKLSIFEYALFHSNIKFITLILAKITQDKLLAFLKKSFYCIAENKKERTKDSLTGLHLIAAKCNSDAIKAILDACSANIDDLLMTQNNIHGLNVAMSVCYANEFPSLWWLFYDKAIDKQRLMLQSSTSQWKLIQYVLRYDIDSIDLKPLLEVPGNHLVGYIQHNSVEQWTLFHQVAHTSPTNRAYSARTGLLYAAIDKLKQHPEGKKQICKLIFLAKNNNEKTPFNYAIDNNNNALINHFMQFIDFDNYDDLSKYFDQIFKPLNDQQFYSNLSLVGTYNLLIIFLTRKYEAAKLLQLFIDKYQENTASSLPKNAINRINMSLADADASFNNKLLMTNPQFSFYPVMSKLPELTLASPELLMNAFDPDFFDWVYRKIFLDILIAMDNKNPDNWRLPNNLQKRLEDIANKSDKSLSFLFRALITLYGQPNNALNGFTALNNEYGPQQKNNRFSLAINSHAKLPEGYFLLAVCYRHGKGTSINVAQTANYLSKVNDTLLTAIKDNDSEDKYNVKEYLLRFSQLLLTKLREYADKFPSINYTNKTAAIHAINDKRNLIILLTKLLCHEHAFKGCEKYLEILENSDEKTLVPLSQTQKEKMGELYSTLCKMPHILADKENVRNKALVLQYGPYYIELALACIGNHSPPDFCSAASHYYIALTTSNCPQAKFALEGLVTCIKGGAPQDRLYLTETLTHIRDQITLQPTNQQSKDNLQANTNHYKSFLEFLSEQEGYILSKIILVKLIAENDYKFLHGLIDLCIGKSYKNPIQISEDKLNKLHDCLKIEFLKLQKSPHLQLLRYKIFICLALIDFKLESSNELKQACEINIAETISFLNIIIADKNTFYFARIKERVTRMGLYIKNHKDVLTKKSAMEPKKYGDLEDLQIALPFSPSVQRRTSKPIEIKSHPLANEDDRTLHQVRELPREDDNKSLYPSLSLPSSLTSTPTQSTDAYVISELRRQLTNKDEQIQQQQSQLQQQHEQMQQHQRQLLQQQEQIQQQESQLQQKLEQIKQMDEQALSKMLAMRAAVKVVNTLSEHIQALRQSENEHLPSLINK